MASRFITNTFYRFIQLPFTYHLVLGFVVRLLLIIYGCYHDATYHLKYTDVDYRVFTDAARHVWNGQSPYERHTYRYSPIIAWLMVPNVFIHETFGKVLFCIADILLTICIKSFVFHREYRTPDADIAGKYCSLYWLYNPFSIAISTRGNADSISCLIIILSIYFLETEKIKLWNIQYALSGLFLGLAIHLRLYPIVFSFPMYLSLGKYTINRRTRLWEGLKSLIPNWKQILLTLSTIASFAAFTGCMYLIYGYQFLFESYIYHLFRTDTRHNFSLFFYYSYLRMNETSFDFIKFTTILFVCAIMILLSLSFGSDPRTLPFALFCQAFVLVTYNSVVTSQYFLWYLSLLPLIVHNIRVTVAECKTMCILWIANQLSWLMFAYLLEMLTYPVLIIIWANCVSFFFACAMVLYHFIKYYSPCHYFNIPYRKPKPKEG